MVIVIASAVCVILHTLALAAVALTGLALKCAIHSGTGNVVDTRAAALPAALIATDSDSDSIHTDPDFDAIRTVDIHLGTLAILRDCQDEPVFAIAIATDFVALDDHV